MLRLAILCTLAASCSDKREPTPSPEPTPIPAPAPPPRPPPPPKPAGLAPDCAPVLAGLEVAKLCGSPFQLVVSAADGRCSLVPGPESPRDYLVRIDVKRATTRRLPASHPAGGWLEDRGRISRARRGAFPWLIDVRSRGPETALCAGDEITAVAARVAELLPPDPDAAEAPPNRACDAILTAARVNAACKTELESLQVGELEGGDDTVCARSSPGMGLVFSVSKRPSRSTGGEPAVDARGNIAVADTVAGYTVELASSRAAGSGELLCTEKQLVELFKRIRPRAARALGK